MPTSRQPVTVSPADRSTESNGPGSAGPAPLPTEGNRLAARAQGHTTCSSRPPCPALPSTCTREWRARRDRRSRHRLGLRRLLHTLSYPNHCQHHCDTGGHGQSWRQCPQAKAPEKTRREEPHGHGDSTRCCWLRTVTTHPAEKSSLPVAGSPARDQRDRTATLWEACGNSLQL